MAGEIGGPPGMPEFKAPKDDDEEAKPRFSFLRPKEEESPPDVPPPAELFAANAESDDDEEEGSLMDRFMKTFGGKVKETVEIEAADNAETIENETEEAEVVAPIDATAEDAAVVPEMPPIEAVGEIPPVDETETEAEEAEPTEEVPFEIAEDFTESEEPAPEEEPIEAEVEEPVEHHTEVPEDVVEAEPAEAEVEEDEPDTASTRSSGSRGANPLTSALPGVAAATSAGAAAAEAADPNKQVGKAASNALPLVGLGLAAYANHKANKARREVRAEQKSREQQMKEIAQEQAKQQQELQAKLNQLNVAPMPAAIPAIEREESKAPETAEATDKIPSKTDQQLKVKATQTVEATPVAPQFEQENPKAPAVEQEVTAPVEASLPAVEKTQSADKIPSIGDILAEKTPVVQGVEKQAELQKEKVLEDEQEFDLEARLKSQELLESTHSDRAAELYYQHVEAAAEQGLAIENQYEKQHEMKDVSSIATGATVVGVTSTVSKDDLFQKDSPDDMAQFVRANYDGSSTTYQTPIKQKLKPEYKQAMVRGVAGAGAIIIGSIIWAIL